MATGGAPRRDGPVALSALFDDALRELVPRAPPTPPAPRGAAAASPAAPVSDGFLYSGNRHESVPRALFLDRRLTPLERNAWQVFRLQLQIDGVTAFPTYDQLRPYLASMPCAAQASHETVARALTLLRLTRWLSLVRRRRDPKTGRILSNLYVLHDEPLTPFEAMQLDPDYLGLVSQALTHAAKAVQIVGMNTLREIAEDPMLNGRTLPTRLQVLAQRMARNEWADASYPQAPVDHESEEGQDGLLRNLEGPSSESEAGLKSAPDGSLRNPKEDRTVRMDRINQVRTVPRAKSLQHLRLPERLLRLKDEQQSGAMVALQQVDESLRQAVLDEWDARCRNSAVRNPAGYLFGIIQKAIRGEFKAWAGEGGSPSTPPAPPPRPAAPAPSAPPPPAPNGPDREAARAYLAKLRSTLGDS
ncbi:STY4528 family pathogenicity island replication protein [Pseudomonas aeruginosa]|uniref:STY4528 family pathogenicity island replication protein n=1 Tax=Gammaproteobacteria TaxID=1236 RepID=UPI000F53038A|nr:MULTISPECIES: STY4528 family pathogenicity island replication protein [Gammaproteobacteria]MCP8478386.1 STY4528 family pathogenicity island replication protein [Pseudomonas triclosanedens]MCR3874342.1 STY4528 family pathogenicity island replication protein [Pseudomonas aeruginosa]MCT0266203.1 STY4528 family pathogenicity island replication protein [Pseudomonas aeruginosa]MCT0704087.1 STY4528 family pathogenicity island replication protein [Pseudomonas aeruginosa]MDQ2173275.1 STY4528 family 